MKNKLLIISMVLIAMVVCIGGAYATSEDIQPPRLPCEYYGEVTIGGAPAPVGTVIIAKIGYEGVGYTQTTVSGIYGNIMTQNNGGPVENPTIDFYVNGIKADQTSVFYEGGAINLDLSIGQTPTPTVVPTPVVTPTPDQSYPPSNKVTGKIYVPPTPEPEPIKFVTITPPGAYLWNLSLDNPNNNQITIGDVNVVANCNYILSIQGSTGGYMIGTAGAGMSFATLKNPVLVFDGDEFLPIEDWVDGVKVTALPIYTGSSGEVDVPITLQQVLVPADADKIDPAIVFTYIYETL